MGTFKDGSKMGRDGITRFDDMDAFGQEWQVLESEESLFLTSRHPQHPAKCIMPDPTKKDGRRRLGAGISQGAAEKACGHLDETKDMCIKDILATNDLDLPLAGVY